MIEVAELQPHEIGRAEERSDSSSQPDEVHRDRHVHFAPVRLSMIPMFGLVRRPIPVDLLENVERGSSNPAIAL